MSNSVSTPQRILTMADWYEKGSARQAREEGYAISKEPTTSNYHKWVKKQVEDILEAEQNLTEIRFFSSAALKSLP